MVHLNSVLFFDQIDEFAHYQFLVDSRVLVVFRFHVNVRIIILVSVLFWLWANNILRLLGFNILGLIILFPPCKSHISPYSKKQYCTSLFKWV